MANWVLPVSLSQQKKAKANNGRWGKIGRSVKRQRKKLILHFTPHCPMVGCASDVCICMSICQPIFSPFSKWKKHLWILSFPSSLPFLLLFLPLLLSFSSPTPLFVTLWQKKKEGLLAPLYLALLDLFTIPLFHTLITTPEKGCVN